MISNAPPESDRNVVRWLFACAALVFAMVVVGGVTRLTHSGLSIVEWKPLVGTIPPITAADWAEVFDKYKATPEYVRVNRGMSLDAFKVIFFWEYVHRLLGRVIGLAVFVPLVVFWRRGAIPRRYAARLLGIFALGGLQGAMGWYMVKSGLVDDPRVSPYRLAAHLGLAFAIFAALVWTALDLRDGEGSREARPKPHLRAALGLVGLVFVMVVSGGFVAGTRAGFAFNTFPWMAGRLVPDGLFVLEPWWRNFVENIPLVQFDHRVIALLVAVGATWLSVAVVRGSASPRARLAGRAVLGALAVQLALGITTLLLVVPTPLAAMHQAGAVVLFGSTLWLAHALRTG